MPIVSGPHRVTAERGTQEGGAIVLRTSHDGYAASFDVIHQRSLMLAADGRRLDGEDLFTPAHRRRRSRPAATNSRSGSTCIPRSRPTA